jgi:hypothetical protein
LTPRARAAASAFFCPLADHAGFQFGDARHLLQHEAPGCAFDLRQVDETNLDAGLEEL